MGEITRAAVKLSRQDAEEIVQKIYTLYEAYIGKAPEGFSFPELYDVQTVQPMPHYLDLYDEVKAELAELGLAFD